MIFLGVLSKNPEEVVVDQNFRLKFIQSIRASVEKKTLSGIHLYFKTINLSIINGRQMVGNQLTPWVYTMRKNGRQCKIKQEIHIDPISFSAKE